MLNLIKSIESPSTGDDVGMNPNDPIVLKDKNAKSFDKYQKSKSTKKERQFMAESEEFYRNNCS